MTSLVWLGCNNSPLNYFGAMTNLAPVTEACECTLKQVSRGLGPDLSGPELELHCPCPLSVRTIPGLLGPGTSAAVAMPGWLLLRCLATSPVSCLYSDKGLPRRVSGSLPPLWARLTSGHSPCGAALTELNATAVKSQAQPILCNHTYPTHRNKKDSTQLFICNMLTFI